jgi:hypothetical protein
MCVCGCGITPLLCTHRAQHYTFWKDIALQQCEELTLTTCLTKQSKTLYFQQHRRRHLALLRRLSHLFAAADLLLLWP